MSNPLFEGTISSSRNLLHVLNKRFFVCLKDLGSRSYLYSRSSPKTCSPLYLKHYFTEKHFEFGYALKVTIQKPNTQYLPKLFQSSQKSRCFHILHATDMATQRKQPFLNLLACFEVTEYHEK
jgi:hypothetical protein